MSAGDSAELVERGDLDDLTRRVDRLCHEERWDDLVDLRQRCRAALQRGRQLWPVASYIEFRLALDAPGPWAAACPRARRGAFRARAAARGGGVHSPLGGVGSPPEPVSRRGHGGPRTGGPRRGPERRGVGRIPPRRARPAARPAGVGAGLCPRRVRARSTPRPGAGRRPLAAAGADPPAAGRPATEDPDSISALTELASAWVGESNGRATSVAVHGTARAAVCALGAPSPRLAEIDRPGRAGPDGVGGGQRRGPRPPPRGRRRSLRGVVGRRRPRRSGERLAGQRR